MAKVSRNENTKQERGGNTPNLLRLYRLVNSMTPAQKRDFRKYSRFWGEATRAESEESGKAKSVPYYIQLFDALNRFVNDKRELEDLQKHLERHRLGNRATLSDRAGYLYNCILESLRTTPDHGRLFNQLNGLMQDISTLHHKGLNKDAQILVAQARQIARDLDKPTYLLELLWWEESLRIKDTEPSKVMAANESNYLAQEQMIRHHQRVNELRSLNWLLSAEGRSVDPSLEVVPEHLRPLFEMEVKDAWQTMPGFRAKQFFLLASRNYSGIASKIFPEKKQDWSDKMFEAQDLLVRAYRREFNVFAKEEPASYWILLENHITLCQRLNKRVQADELLEVLSKEAGEHLLIYTRLNQYMANLDVAEALKYIDRYRIFSKFDQIKEDMRESRQIIICYQCGLCYFLDGRWGESRRWFAKTLEGHRPDAHHIAVTLTHLLDILCAFKMKAYKIPISRVFENFEARQQRAGQWSVFLENLTLLLKNHMAGQSPEETEAPLAALREEVLQNKDTHFGPYASVLAWVEARLYHTDTLAELKKYV
jgi:hypothetical protein